MRLGLKIAITFVIFTLVGIVAGPIFSEFGSSLQEKAVYHSSNTALVTQFESSNLKSLTWQQLLPESEKSVLEKYQTAAPTNSVDDITQNILNSIQASSDSDYQAAMYSLNTIGTYNNQSVSIAGFVVPVEYHADNSASLVFIVPYFGACIHFPPPPPNQIIFARLAPGFTDIDLAQAYSIRGMFGEALFEDPLGTAAYELEVVSIHTFSGEPDDFRSH